MGGCCQVQGSLHPSYEFCEEILFQDLSMSTMFKRRVLPLNEGYQVDLACEG